MSIILTNKFIGGTMMKCDNGCFKIDGMYYDIIKRNGKIEITPCRHNLVVTSVTKLISALLGGKISSGIKYWAVGSGDDSWDTNPADPQLSEVRLTNEIGRKVITADDIEFYDSNNNPSPTPTNRLHIHATFGEDECNGKWREFGLFGGDDASVVVNSGIMVDKKHHDVITKTSDTIIERHIVLTFNLA